MAKVTISADTMTGEMECHIDGKAMENVTGCDLYRTERYDNATDKYVPAVGMSMRMKPTKENGVVYNMTAYASEHPKAIAAINKKTAEFIAEDVVVIPDYTALASDVSRALGR
jgi:hypothetical protein